MLNLKKLYDADGMGGAYGDTEKIDYEGLSTSLNEIISRVSEGSELHKEIEKVNELATELTVAWKSPESQKAKNSIDEVNVELSNVRSELNNLLGELSKYNEAAQNINAGVASDLNGE